MLNALQKLFHRQSLRQTPAQWPLWQNIQHAVLQLCHEERWGTLAKLQVSLLNEFIVSTENSFLALTVWLHQTRIGLSLYDVAGQGYLRESVSAVLCSLLSGVAVCRLQVWLLWPQYRIWRTTSWSWSPRCLSSTGWRSPSTRSTSALLFESSFSSWIHFEQVSQKPRPRKTKTRERRVQPQCE